MKKWIGLSLSIVFIFSLASICSSFPIFKQTINGEGKWKQSRMISAQDAEKEGKKGETDPHFILILKQLREKLDAWLKSLNERIESEDITRFEVRFLEILRNILEWLKEKIDSKIASSEEKKQEKKERRGIFRETHQNVSPFYKTG